MLEGEGRTCAKNGRKWIELAYSILFVGDIVLVIGSVMEKHLELRVIESYSWEW